MSSAASTRRPASSATSTPGIIHLSHRSSPTPTSSPAMSAAHGNNTSGSKKHTSSASAAPATTSSAARTRTPRESESSSKPAATKSASSSSSAKVDSNPAAAPSLPSSESVDSKPRSSIPLPLGAGTPFYSHDYSSSSYSDSPPPPLHHRPHSAPARATNRSASTNSPSKRSARRQQDPSNENGEGKGNANGARKEDEDQWDMPMSRKDMDGSAGVVSSDGGPTANLAGGGNGNLTWQQESLAGLSITSSPTPAVSSSSKQANGRQNRKGVASSSSVSITSKPLSHHTRSVSNIESLPNLNWQEALSALPQQPSHQSSLASHSMTPGKSANRRQKLLDESTFGTSPSSSSQDVFTSPHPSSLRASPRPSPARRPSPTHHQSSSTPTRAQNSGTVTPLEPRYAGPTFHNSPAPSSLGIPSFLAKKRAAAALADGGGI